MKINKQQLMEVNKMEKLFEAMLRENKKYVDGLETMTKEEQIAQLKICEAYNTVIINMGVVDEWKKYFDQHYKPSKCWY